MNKNPKLTMILALVGGLALANASIGQSFAYTASAEKTMFGHFTLIVKDEFGNIKDYIEVDNVITDQGDACLANLTFATTATCTGGAVDSIAISDCSGAGGTDPGNTDCAVIGDTTTQFDDTAGALDTGDHCDTGAEVTRTFTDRIANGGATAKVRLSATFDSTELAMPFTAKEVGILNSAGASCAATDELFAIKTFANVALSGTDTITVNYDVSYSG